MYRFFENKVAFAAILLSFSVAFAWNLTQGTKPCAAHEFFQAAALKVAHGPILPPDPWAGGSERVTVAHGPMLPPDPWAGGSERVTVAHGPMLPPDPWAGGANERIAA